MQASNPQIRAVDLKSNTFGTISHLDTISSKFQNWLQSENEVTSIEICTVPTEDNSIIAICNLK